MVSDGPWVERILRVVDHIHAHLDEEISPEELARIAHFSLHHFHRVFRGMTGESVMGFVRRLRLERAAQRLKFGREPVVDVALATGYGSHEAFTRAFRARFGSSPSRYRDQVQVDVSAAVTFKVRDEPERHCIGLRHTGDYVGCEVIWGDVAVMGQATGLAEQSIGSVGLVYDDPDVTAARHLRYDACLVLAPERVPTELPDRCTYRVIPAGQYAIAHHRGPYEELQETYVSLLGRWLPTRNVELSDLPVVEIYINTPDTAAPADLETEVCVRIQ